METVIIELDGEEAALVKWVMQAATTNEDLPLLQYLFVDGDVLAATNGWLVNAAPRPNAFDEHIGKALRPVRTPTNGPNIFEVFTDFDRFPDWRTSVHPPTETTQSILIDAAMLEKAFAAHKKQQSTYIELILHRPYDDGDDVIMHVRTPHGFSGVMPLNRKNVMGVDNWIKMEDVV